jgi:hypothetical protein
MSDTNYTAFFKAATGGSHSPYDYQSRLALGEADLPNAGAACHSRLINIPTGLGKTADSIREWFDEAGRGEVSGRQEIPPRVSVATRRSEKSVLFDTCDHGFNDAVLHKNLVAN